jgi:hypothetical protein
VIVLSNTVTRPIPDFDRKIVIVPSRVPSRILTDCPVPAYPVPWQDFELVPLSQDNEGTSVPLSRKVGNPSLDAQPETQVLNLL